MKRFYWLGFGVLAACLSLPGMALAQYYDTEGNGAMDNTGGGIESIHDPMDSPPQYASPVQYVPVVPPPAPPAPKAHWYDRIKHKAEKTVDTNLQRVAPKEHKEQGKLTQIVADAMIRMPRGLSYNGTLLPPGIYLLSLQADALGTSPLMQLTRQDQVLLSFPTDKIVDLPPPHTKPVNMIAPPPTAPEEDPPPSGRHGRHGGGSSRKPKNAPITPAVSYEPPPLPPVIEKIGSVSWQDNGQSAVFTLEQNNKRYTSVPIPTSDSWQKE